MNSITFLNEHGDITITWDESNSEEVKQMIQQKLDAGYKFFIVDKKFGFIPNKTKLTHVSQLKDSGKILMKDKEVEKLFFEGHVNISSERPTSNVVAGLATTVSQVVANTTIATRPAIGG